MKPSLLIIEDDSAITDSLEIALRKKGFDISCKDNLVIEELNTRPDIILMDVFISGKLGTDLCLTLKSHPMTANIPVLMMSASPTKCGSCLNAGADDFIAKPFRLSELVDKLNNLLENYNLACGKDKENY